MEPSYHSIGRGEISNSTSPVDIVHEGHESTEKLPSKEIISTTKEVTEQQETCYAKKLNYRDATWDVVVAILPLYFTVFAIVAFKQNNKTSDVFKDDVILQMQAFVRSYISTNC